MITEKASSTTMSPATDTANESSTQLRVFLVRGLIAIVWAALFAAVAGSATTTLTVTAGVVLVLYPLIDAVASLLDARNQHGPAQRLLFANAAVSTVAAAALGVAASQGLTHVFVVFGVWAALAGAAQLVVALHRRAQLGRQWPMLLAGGVSVLFGAAFIFMATAGNAMPAMIVVYAATGGVDFVIEALLLVRRRRLAAAAKAR
jgi:uncharacterized membrane protein HdeD (DUF308 family)